MEIRPISLKEANSFVENYHRHHPKVQGHKFSISAYHNGELCGVAIVGHPQGRFLDDGLTLEVLRLCTDGTRNSCSFLYGRCAKIAKDMGYRKIITYILESEDGTSLKAAGWTCESEKCGGVSWNGRNRDSDNFEQLSLFEKKQVPKQFKKRYVRLL